MLKKWGPFFLTLIISITLAIMASTPPTPKDLNTPADQFSSARAMKDVTIIASEPHPTGSKENEKVRTYLTNRLNKLGMDVDISESKLDERSLKRLNRWSGETKTEQSIFNIIATLPGEGNDKSAILLMAHHDTVWGSPGAADDTVGIASILEIVRTLKAVGPQKRDLIVLFTDAEELGLVGAVNFFKNNPLSNKIGAVINFEARGGGGTVSMFQTSAQNGNAARLYASAVREPSTSSLSTFVYNVLPNDTDLTPALEKDYVAYNIANLGRAEYYHSPKINAEALDESTLQHMGSQGLDLTRALLSASDLPAEKPDATFFDLFGFFTIIYSPFWGWIFLTIAVLCYALSIDRKASLKDMFSGFIKMLSFMVLGGGFLFALNKLSGSGGSANYYDRLAAIPKLEFVALFLCLAMFVALFGYKSLSGNARLGAVLPLLFLGLLGQVFAPTAAYFITLSVMLCAITSLASQRWPDKKFERIITVILASLVIGYMLTLGHLLMLGVGPDMLTVAILPAAIAGLAIMPLYPALSKRMSTVLAITGLLASTCLALWIRLDPIASTVPLY